ncbi:MAG TPA: DedA family protein [bacterium]|nr:DedA family protein [bacterium]
MLIENIFPPLPSEIILGLTGFIVGKGELNLWLAVLSATAGVLLSAIFMYMLGFYGGRPLVDKFGRRFRISSEDIVYTEKWFERFGPSVIFFGRFLPIIRTLVSLPAGLARMHFIRFLLLTAIPSALWSLGIIYAGSLLGDNWTSLSAYLKKIEVVLLVLATAILLIILYRSKERILKKFFPMEK